MSVLRSNKLTRGLVDSENTPPTILIKGRTTLDASKKRRTRTFHPSPSHRTQKYLIEQAKRKEQMKTKPGSPAAPRFCTFTVARVPQPSQASTPEVEMKDETPAMQEIKIPIQLTRPDYTEVSQAALAAIDPDWEHIAPEYIREKLETLSLSMVDNFYSAPLNLPKDALPESAEVLLKNPHGILPSHLAAVHSATAPPSTLPRKVTVYPVHNALLAAHCSRLPPFAQPKEKPTASADGRINLPIRSMALPAPECFVPLMTYLYTKNSYDLLQALFLEKPPQNLEEDQKEMIPHYATKLGRANTYQGLMLRVIAITGVWKNACALGIFDDGLWDTLDLAWDVITEAFNVAAGQPQFVIQSFKRV
ncbi:hypothetical protein EST38_g3366 [Candolleomyces aberdarensis]|uniref:Clp1 n=1 Tax=Candolleomyces aberdarensis TaxID=2316362 RepID=A0A4Q2DUA4_9AGAR|nr:hypothetical protein EST38_g3366 [Candolleomyces aberdarensis]